VAPLRVGLVGYGLAGRVFHGRLIKACADLSIAAVVTANPQRAAQVAEDLPDARVVPTLDALLMDAAELDLVVVATTNAVHHDAAIAALDAGCAVVVDKPLSVTAAEAADLVAHAAGRPLTVFQNRRWDSDQLTLRRFLSEGRLGPVWRHESRFERFREVLDTGRWRETLTAEEGGGQLLDLGSHLVDQAVQLFGPVSQVYAEIEHRRGGGDDAVFVALTHVGGVHSHLSIGAVFGSPGPRRRVLGDAGAVVVPRLDSQEDQLRAGMDPNSAAFGMEPEDNWPLLVRGDEVVTEHPQRGQWDSFYPAVATALRAGKSMPVDPADAIHVLNVIEAARRSADNASVESL
jgi:scyllo-inositol 2-dehydrogenase (NADP+)